MSHFAVLGSPIQHSLSPTIHRAAYAQLGNNWSFERFEVAEGTLEAFLRTRDARWHGFACTMPLKREAWNIAQHKDSHAIRSGVANTLVRDGDAWFAANTDIPGLEMSLSSLELDPTVTVVLGAGATAVSAILALKNLGASHIEVRARRIESARALAEQFQVQYAPLTQPPVSTPTLVISTLPAGAGETVALPQPLMQVPLFDVAYNPWPSPLTQRWREEGGEGYSGIHMLVHQAVFQMRLFNGGSLHTPLPHEVDVVQAMRKALPGSMGQ